MGDGDEDIEVEEVSSDEWDEDEEGAILPNDCLFCEHHSANIDKVTRNEVGSKEEKSQLLKFSWFFPSIDTEQYFASTFKLVGGGQACSSTHKYPSLVQASLNGWNQTWTFACCWELSPLPCEFKDSHS